METNLWWQKAKQWIAWGQGVGGCGAAGMGREWRIAGGNEETSVLDCDNGFTVVYICQNLSDPKL